MTLRTANRVGFLLLPVLISAIYSLKQNTRLLAAEVRALEAEVAKLHRDEAVLKAEFGFLAGPGRIDRLARKHLWLKEPRADQYIALPKAATTKGPFLPAHRLPGDKDDITATIQPEIIPAPEDAR